MCGLFGMMGPGITTYDLRFIRELAYVSGLRGTDGTGILQGVSYKKQKTGFYYEIEKLPSEVSYFTWHHQYGKDGNREVLNSVTDTFMAGHVRASTRGANTLENTHPFELKEIVGMHNGTLLDKKYEHKTKTDSELFFEDIQANGFHKVLGNLDKGSAYAICVMNLTTGEFTFARNELRPLACAWNSKRRVFYWASEIDMLMFCARRNTIPIDKYFNVTPHVLHTFRPYDVEIGRRPNWRLQPIVATKKEEPVSFNRGPFRGSRTLPEEEQTNKTFASNVIALPDLRAKDLIKPKRTRSELVVKCITCREDMDPLDQHLGTEMSSGKYQCQKCDDLTLVVAKSIN